MKMLILGISVILITSCGGGKGSSGSAEAALSCTGLPSLGWWKDIATASDILLRANCTGEDFACDSEFAYESESNGATVITVQSTNGDVGCLPIGRHLCQVNYDSVSAEELSIECQGEAVRTFERAN